MLIRFSSSIEGDDKSSYAPGALEKAKRYENDSSTACLSTYRLVSSLQAVEEKIDRWSQAEDPSDMYLQLIKYQAELDNIHFNMLVGAHSISKSKYTLY